MEEKQEKFKELYLKFVKKCLQEGIYPVNRLEYDKVGIYPVLDFLEITEDQKQEILSSLNKKK